MAEEKFHLCHRYKIGLIHKSQGREEVPPALQVQNWVKKSHGRGEVPPSLQVQNWVYKLHARGEVLTVLQLQNRVNKSHCRGEVPAPLRFPRFSLYSSAEQNLKSKISWSKHIFLKYKFNEYNKIGFGF